MRLARRRIRGRILRHGGILTVLAVAVAFAGACGGGGVEAPADSADVATASSETSPTVPETASTSAGSVPASSLSAYQAVVVERNDDVLTVSAGVGDRDWTPLYTADLALPGWDGVSISPYTAYEAHPFSADFSKVLFYGTPTGLETHHIGILDLVTGEATDLTAFRQGSDFEDPILCEDSPGFASEIIVPRSGLFVVQPRTSLINPSERIVFHGREGTLGRAAASCFGDQAFLTSLSDPATATPVPANREALSERIVASEDGKYQFGRLPDSKGSPEGQSLESGIDGFLTPGASRVAAVNCRPDGLAPSASAFGQYFLGWVGPRTVALAIGVPSTSHNVFDWRTATLEEDGTVTCKGGIPQTGREIGDVALSYDGTAILFTAEGAGGPEQYRQPLDATSPEAAGYPEDPTEEDRAGSVDVYRVGPTG